MTRKEFRMKIPWWEANGPITTKLFLSGASLLTYWSTGFCYNADKYFLSVTTQNMSMMEDQGRKK